MSYLPDIPHQIRSSALQCPLRGRNEAFTPPHVVAQRAPVDATEARTAVQFSKVTVLSASWEKLPGSVKRPPSLGHPADSKKCRQKAPTLFLQRPQPNTQISP